MQRSYTQTKLTEVSAGKVGFLRAKWSKTAKRWWAE